MYTQKTEECVQYLAILNKQTRQILALHYPALLRCVPNIDTSLKFAKKILEIQIMTEAQGSFWKTLTMSTNMVVMRK